MPKLDHGAQGLEHWGLKIFMDGNSATCLDSPLLCLTAITEKIFFFLVFEIEISLDVTCDFHLVLCPVPLYLWGGSRSLTSKQTAEGSNPMSPFTLHFWEQAQQPWASSYAMCSSPLPFLFFAICIWCVLAFTENVGDCWDRGYIAWRVLLLLN